MTLDVSVAVDYRNSPLDSEPPLTKKQIRARKRLERAKGSHPSERAGQLEIRKITPKTVTQKKVFDSWGSDKNPILLGTAGTGKSFIACFLAIMEVMFTKSPRRKVIIVRSAVQGRNQGFMPGGPAEKQRLYEDPYRDIFAELFGRGDAYELLKKRGYIEFTTTSFLRSITFRDSVVVVDEFQNMTDVELHTVITRLGDNSKLIMCGDANQNDLKSYRNQESGLDELIGVLKQMPSVSVHEFRPEDVVRSGFVREYILTREKVLSQPF